MLRMEIDTEYRKLLINAYVVAHEDLHYDSIEIGEINSENKEMNKITFVEEELTELIDHLYMINKDLFKNVVKKDE